MVGNDHVTQDQIPVRITYFEAGMMETRARKLIAETEQLAHELRIRGVAGTAACLDGAIEKLRSAVRDLGYLHTSLPRD